MKINFGAKCCFFVVTVLCLLVVVKDFAGTLLPTPTPGKQYAIGDLYNLITTNNKSLNFFVPATGKSQATLAPIQNSANWAASLANLTGRIYANDSRIGCSPSSPNWNTIKNQQVTLLQDTDHINHLVKIGHLTTAIVPGYTKILLYFLYPVNPAAGQPQYRLYLNDVFPGIAVRGRPVPAQSIISNWS